ncbi:MAG: hypothetical protein RBR13_08025 [Tenuifilaceae bacterium]|jgi:hypothetical protein|nr:hypothetical protein [Tenuifilaceae bacterium]
MAWCTREDLTQYVLAAYLDAADGKNPGVVDRAMAAVHGEMAEALLAGGFGGYNGSSAILTRIAAVLSAWRSVAAITSLVQSEGGGTTEWNPLLHERRKAEADLDAIRRGILNPFPAASSGGVMQDAGTPFFTESLLRGFL